MCATSDLLVQTLADERGPRLPVTDLGLERIPFRLRDVRGVRNNEVPPLLDRFQPSLVQIDVEKGRIPGAVVLVARDGKLLLHEAVNLGVAVATDRGLVVPNIKAADQLSLVELVRAVDQLTSTARDGRTQPADQAGGTFTITNIGVLGIDAGTPILNIGEAGILAVGAIQRRPWVTDDDAVEPRWVTTLALSFDHRIVDGAEAARFLTDVADILRNPATALTY